MVKQIEFESKLSNNNNGLSPNAFMVNINVLPNVEFFAQNLSIPSITCQKIQIESPKQDYYVPSDKLYFDDLSITFLVDEDLRSFKELFDLLRNVVKTPEKWFTDISVSFLTNNRNYNKRITFKNCILHTIGEIQLDTKQSEDANPTCTATFAYSHFTFE